MGRGGRRWLAGAAILGSILALWSARGLMIKMPGRSHTGALPQLGPAERGTAARLARDVERLAGEIGERNVWHPRQLEAAARYLEAALAASGYRVDTQQLESGGRHVRNIEAERPGGEVHREIVLVGAHYDSVLGCPGANDNATGVAALLELARRFAGRSPQRTLRFVAFVNEEPPFFQTSGMGSLAYARRARARNESIVAMLSLETIGCYHDAPGSQRYPFPFGLIYPSAANFIGFVGNLASGGLVRRVVGSFRRHAQFPSEGTAAPGWLTGVAWSDHWAFWQQGYPAVMITDTALFRYAHYHAPSDTPDKIDYERMARVVDGVDEAIQELSNED